MEREIKFRGHKCQGGGKWIYGNCLMQNKAGTCYISNDIAPSKTNDEKYSEVVHVCQFTDKGCIGTAYYHGEKSGWIVYGDNAYKEFGNIVKWMHKE
jgi:hypothetical protein